NSIASAFNRRQIFANSLAADPVALDVVIFERHGVQSPRNGIAEILRALEGGIAAGIPFKKISFRRRRDRRAFKLLAPGVDDPQARGLSEPRTEIKAVVLAVLGIGRGRQRHFSVTACPALIFKAR